MGMVIAKSDRPPILIMPLIGKNATMMPCRIITIINALGMDFILSAKYPQNGGETMPITENTAKISPTSVLENPSFCSSNVLNAAEV